MCVNYTTMYYLQLVRPVETFRNKYEILKKKLVRLTYNFDLVLYSLFMTPCDATALLTASLKKFYRIFLTCHCSLFCFLSLSLSLCLLVSGILHLLSALSASSCLCHISVAQETRK